MVFATKKRNIFDDLYTRDLGYMRAVRYLTALLSGLIFVGVWRIREMRLEIAWFGPVKRPG